jgi:hypothetical protein
MTQESLKLALAALEINLTLLEKITPYKGQEDFLSDSLAITQDTITAIKEALAQHDSVQAKPEPEQEPVAVYGYCPECGAKGVMRERRPNGNDKCAKGHTYPSNTATPPQRTWVGLASEDRLTAKYMQDAPDGIEAVIDYIEAKLKELNT